MPLTEDTRRQYDAIAAALFALVDEPPKDEPAFFRRVITDEAEIDQLIDPFTVDGPMRIPEHLRAPALKSGLKSDRILMETVISRDYRTCYLCGHRAKAEETVTIDHIVPRSLGGQNTLDNLGVLCPPCNMRKGERLTRRRPSALGATFTVEEAIAAASR